MASAIEVPSSLFPKLRRALEERFGGNGLPLRNALVEEEAGGALMSHTITRYWVDKLEEPRIIAQTVDFERQDNDAAEKHYRHLTCAAANDVEGREVKSFFEHSGVVDWGEETLFVAADAKWEEWLRELFVSKGGSFGLEEASYVYAFNGACPSNPGSLLPAGYSLGPLEAEHAEVINAEWKFGAGQRTLDYIRRNVVNFGKIGATRGVFHSEGGEDGGKPTIAAWGLMQSYGAIGMLQTRSEHRRLGLGRVIASDLCRWCIDRGWVPYCVIEADNTASMTLFEKLGFQRDANFQATWAFFWPAGSSFKHSGRRKGKDHVPGACT